MKKQAIAVITASWAFRPDAPGFEAAARAAIEAAKAEAGMALARLAGALTWAGKDAAAAAVIAAADAVVPVATSDPR